MRPTRLAFIATGVALAASLAACVSRPVVPVSVTVPPAAVYPAPAATTTAAATLEFGRVTGIEYFPGGVTSSGINVPGAIVGGVAGAVLGNQIGSGSGRDAATVLGGAAGAAVGSQVGRTGGTVTNPVYRVSIQTDQGAMRAYDVPGTGDLRIGDRVRIENGVIYRA
jgi:outer membrane lipoprotein SlyB